MVTHITAERYMRNKALYVTHRNQQKLFKENYITGISNQVITNEYDIDI